eukprot:723241-Amphidinium_carterae.1
MMLCRPEHLCRLGLAYEPVVRSVNTSWLFTSLDASGCQLANARVENWPSRQLVLELRSRYTSVINSYKLHDLGELKASLLAHAGQ